MQKWEIQKMSQKLKTKLILMIFVFRVDYVTTRFLNSLGDYVFYFLIEYDFPFRKFQLDSFVLWNLEVQYHYNI